MSKSPSVYQKDFYICSMMRIGLLLWVLTFYSCKTGSKENNLANTIIGDWIVLYPDHQLKNEEERMAFGAIQDSVMSRKSLKMISFFEGGLFRQMDVLTSNGRWDAKQSAAFTIQEGGEGFENFKTNIITYDDDMLQLSETVNHNTEQFRLIWHLKKIDKKLSKKLFSPEANVWRIKPKKPETNEEIKKRLATILLYYADYYNWVAEESSFFIGRRILLPFEYFQNAIGTKDFDPESDFAGLFYDQAAAVKAYEYLQDVVSVLRNDFERNKNYVKGYATHMRTMAGRITILP